MSSANFIKFAALLRARYESFGNVPLFRTGVDGDTLWQLYLASFPPGTNELFRKRPEHDGSYDKSFIRRMGNVIHIGSDNKITTMWGGLDAPYPYNVVAEALDKAVREAWPSALFLNDEPTVGVERNVESKDGVLTEFRHYYVKLDPKHVFKKAHLGGEVGKYSTNVQTLSRALNEIHLSAADTVLELIEDKALYRGDEFRKAVSEFRTAKLAWDKLDVADRACWAWRNAGSPLSFFRNSVIGTLLVALSEGEDLEAAVKSYESKVAPSNYKRPTALITQRMIDDAVATIDSLGLRESLERRFAVLSDVNVNDVLWVDNSAQVHMKDGLKSLLGTAVKPSEPKGKAIDIEADAFLVDVAPTATAIELFIKNALRSNLVSLTAPLHADAPPLFKWDNGFGWSYNGNITDSELRAAVAAKGGRVDGAFRFSHMWNYDKRNASLMDLHVFMPGFKPDYKNQNQAEGRRVGWNRRNDHLSGGVQDVDYVDPAPKGYVPVENITFPSLNKMPEGTYICAIHNWQHRTPTEGGFKAEIECGGELYEYEHPRPLKMNEWVEVAHVTLRNGQFTVEHKLNSSTSSVTVWGIQTERFVKVNTIMLSPNHWHGKAVGNKHYIFALDGCVNDEPTRGIYNEFLKPELDKHRKVFEVLGNKTKCQPSANQLSGLGFSSTQRNSVIAKVTSAEGTRLYNIRF